MRPKPERRMRRLQPRRPNLLPLSPALALPPLTPLGVAQGRWRDGTGARSYSREVRTRQAGPRKWGRKDRIHDPGASAEVVPKPRLCPDSVRFGGEEGADAPVPPDSSWRGCACSREWQRGPTPQRIRTRDARGESQVERLERGSPTPVTSAARGDDGPPWWLGRIGHFLISFLFSFFIFFYLISFPI